MFSLFVSCHQCQLQIYWESDYLVLFSFQIDHEFALLYGDKSSLFLRSFSIDFVPKLLKIRESNPTKFGECSYFGDGINFLIALMCKFSYFICVGSYLLMCDFSYRFTECSFGTPENSAFTEKVLSA